MIFSIAVVALVYSGTALAWHANGVTVTAACQDYKYVVSASVQQSSKYPGAFVKSITPSTVPGNTSGSKGVVVVLGWPNSNETQTWNVSVSLDGKCVPPPAPKNCPEGYSEAEGSTADVKLCVKTVTNTVTVDRVQYVDRPVERIVEKIVYVDKPVEVEKIVYKDKIVIKTVIKKVVKIKNKIVVKYKTKVVTKVVKICPVCKLGYRLYKGKCHPIVQGSG